VVNATLRSLYPGRETQYPLYKKLGENKHRSERV
jgi:hypothetical protein